MKLNQEQLKEIYGGDISGTLLSSMVKGITILLELGRSLGSSIRRMVEHNICFYEWLLKMTNFLYFLLKIGDKHVIIALAKEGREMSWKELL